MIGGVSKTEANYRAIMLDSSSSLKDFSFDRKKYYKKYISNDFIDDDDSKASIMGRLVETLLMEPELFDSKFYLSSSTGAPTGLMLDFVEMLYKHTIDNTDESGNVTISFKELSKLAYDDSKFKLNYKTVINKFVGSDAEIYYNEIRIIRPKNLTVVELRDVDNAERIVKELQNNPNTASVVNMVNSDRWQIFNQLQVEDYEIDGHRFKSMMDKVVVDHKKKTIQIYDLKCTWNVENFYEEYYLYRRAYIQGYLYYKAIINKKDLFKFDTSGYEVLLPRFIVCDSTNYYQPLIYCMRANDITDAYDGFEHKGRKYPGVGTLIEDLKWAVKNDVWNISRSNYLSNGLINLT